MRNFAAMKAYKVCMSVAGSDPSGGAGLQADLKTFTILGCYGQAVPTALTVQNTLGVQQSIALEASLVKRQIEAILADCPPRCLKIGIVPHAETALALVHILERREIAFTVIDPVLVSSSGHLLADEGARCIMKERLMPLCRLITPNLPEARILTGAAETSIEDCAFQLFEMLHGPAILLKGGHREGKPTDILCDANGLHYFTAQRIQTHNDHGTGCVLSSAITAYMCHGLSLPEAIEKAKLFVTRALERGADYELGKGHGPMYLLPSEEEDI